MATTNALRSRNTAVRGEEFEYRPLSTTAVASLVFGLLSTLIFLAGRDGIENSLLLTPLPIIGLVLGIKALSHLRANADQFTGGKLAKAGAALSAVCLVGGVAFSGYVYATEVRDGYVRTSFAKLRPDEVELRGNHLIPPAIAKLDGEEVFIKGYMRPGSHYSAGGHPVSNGISSFLLVRDNAQCCYGDLSNVQYFDQVAVVMAGKQRANYHSGLFRMHGTLRVHPEFAGNTSAGPTYLLEADFAE